MSTPKAGLKTMPTGTLKNEQVFNEAVILLEALLYRGVASRAVLDPSGISPSPSNGDVYLINDGSPTSTGDWSGQGGKIAVYFNGWRFLPPGEGLTLWITDETQRVQYRSGVWVDVNEEPAQVLSGLNDVDISGSPSPQDGEALVFDGASQTWKPGQSGAVAFTKVELTGSESVLVNTAVVWDQVRAGETHGTLMWSASQPTRLNAVGRGVYMFGFHGDTAALSTVHFPAIFKNGADKTNAALAESLTRSVHPSGGSGLWDILGAGILDDGDFIEAVANSIAFTLDATNKTSFWMLKVAAL